jgi:exonuclease SbcC
MLLKSLKLKNIRSYNSLNLEFVKGSTLLSGDIGSGKTTILLSIEFALFGIMRGTLSGSALLRHGKKDGSIELEFEIENKSVIINRSLKRTSTGIVQDAGFISINDVKTDGTAIELKSKILEILGYPEELISKSKMMIFRYTVYTPQEEMKQILYESAEERLEKLRKIFDIDKYKRIKENSSNYAKDLRAEIKALSLISENIDQLKDAEKKLALQITEKEFAIKQQEISVASLTKLESSAKLNVEKSQKQLLDLERAKNELRLLVQEKQSLDIQIKNKETDAVSTKKEIEEILSKKEDAIQTRAIKDIQEELLNYKNMQKETEEKIQKVKSNLAVLDQKKKDSNEIVNDINHLENCPTCKQKVSPEHKKLVEGAEKEKLVQVQEKETQALALLEKAKNNILIITKKIDLLAQELRTSELEEYKRKMIDERKKRVILLEEKTIRIKTEIENLKLKQIDSSNKEISSKKKIDELALDEKKVLSEKLEFEQARNNLRRAEILLAELSQQKKAIEQNLNKTKEEILAKEEKKKESEHKKMLENWISNQFINVVDVIEKNVLGSIHSEFSARFQEWFSMLMEDESISATLDDSFAPIIIQNGYETEVENLSGGEKTSIALAYRLALNKVINDFIGTIKTRDLIILDEPTDGFSSEQLDKVRDVLEQLNASQTIIVSHEPKMESFVQNVIRIRKQEHESEVLV